MQIILADAKIMREVPTTAPTVPTSLPIFQNEAEAIAEEMSMMSIEGIQKAFHCSLSIANESLQSFKAFNIQPKSLPYCLITAMLTNISRPTISLMTTLPSPKNT